jgi:hypothetical protein
MKKVFLLLVAIVAFGCLQAQTKLYPYVFGSYTAPYQNLVGSTDLFPGVKVDDDLEIIPIGFPFKWAISSFIVDTLILHSNGLIYTKTTDTFLPGLPNHGLDPLAADLADRNYNGSSIATPKSVISYQTVGAAGDKICKIEYKNMGYYNDTLGNDSINFQVWLYEKDNKIEFHYGPSSADDLEWLFDGANGPHIGLDYKTRVSLANQLYATDSCSYVVGDSTNFRDTFYTNPIEYFTTGTPNDYHFLGLPKPNQVFVYMPAFPAVIGSGKAFAVTKIYPTLVQDALYISCALPQYLMSLTDWNGALIMQKNICNGNQKIDCGHLAKGLYFVKLQAGNDAVVYKIWKQ